MRTFISTVRGGVLPVLLCMSALLPLGAMADAREVFSLDDSLAAHATLRLKPTDLIVAPNGRYVAWVDGAALLVATAPTFEARTVATSVVAAYASSDGQTLLYTRGKLEPAFGSYPQEDSRELWRVPVAGGTSQLLAKGEEVPEGAPVFAPDGRSFVTAEGPMLYEYRLDAEGLRRRPLLKRDAQHYAAIRLSNLMYSPDGRSLAFVSWRKAGQSYVAVHDFATGDYRYIDSGIFRDVTPVWSPDGSQLAFARTLGNWTHEYRFSPKNEAAPWSLMIADAATGKVRTLWRADTGAGSVFQPFGNGAWMESSVETPQLSWTPDGQILFPWEKTGWLSLYAIASLGGKPRQITPGDGEVTLPALDASGRNVIYATNIGDLPRLHLWRASLTGGTPQQLTRGIGVEHSPKMLAGDRFVYIDNENGRMPNRRVIGTGNARPTVLTPLAAERQKNQKTWQQFVDEDVVALTADDGVVSYHMMMVPKGTPPPGGFPVIVSSKGGPDGRVSPGNTVNAALGQYAASRGYVFIDINYRGCFGFGLDYRLPPQRGATGGSEVKDLRALALYLRGRADVNPNRIGIMGGSY
ncbi:S9 family peptidase, partial [Steroidobacter sp.]|uniref:S9 family peptidase n=1 Tax=Steroidobacter sp. TaxID=1978227 RepID=UPI001A4AB5FB